MNSKTLFYSLMGCFFLFTSCKNELQPQENSEVPVVATSESNTPSEVTSAQNAPQPVPQQASAEPSKVAPGMNPPHGQPNHRCDIEVGAPLNSPVKQTQTQQPQPQAQKIQTQPAQNRNVTTSPAPSNAAPVVTAPGMNPPHGQEGHLCEIAVGAPLPKK